MIMATMLQLLLVLLLTYAVASAFELHHDAGHQKKKWSSTPKVADGAVIFLHGMGDTSSGWSSIDHMIPSICPRLSTDNIEYFFPQAPIKPITLNGGELVPAWFDLYDYPVDATTKDDVVGQLNAVCMLEETVKKVELERGIPASRIVVGGFAQGGAVAMLASFFRKERRKQPFAGCVCLSGWLPNSWCFPVNKHVAEMTPLLWCHGSYDGQVLHHASRLGVNRLRNEGIDVHDMSYPCGHESYNLKEIEDMAEFIDDVLFPKVPSKDVMNDVITAEFVSSVMYLFEQNAEQYNP